MTADAIRRFTATAAIVILNLLVMPPSHAAGVPDFSGTWVSAPNRVDERRFVDIIPGGWHRHVENVGAMAEYRIDIMQTAAGVRIVFPRGDSNFLTVPTFPLDGAPRSFVEDLGTRWRQTLTRASWDGQSLTVSAVRMAYRWEEATPATAMPQATDLASTHVLTMNDSRDRLTMRTTVSDEKGTAEYRQVFQRVQ